MQEEIKLWGLLQSASDLKQFLFVLTSWSQISQVSPSGKEWDHTEVKRKTAKVCGHGGNCSSLPNTANVGFTTANCDQLVQAEKTHWTKLDVYVFSLCISCAEISGKKVFLQTLEDLLAFSVWWRVMVFTHMLVGLNFLAGEPSHLANSQVSTLSDTYRQKQITWPDRVDQAVIATYEWISRSTRVSNFLTIIIGMQ